MASKIISLDIGSSTLKLAEFLIPKPGQLQLARYGIAEIGSDPNKEEDTIPLVITTLKKLMKETGIRPGEAHVSLSSHASFLRFVKLPPVDPTQVKQIITFEAQQNVPFPLEEVVWDYQLVMGRSGEAMDFEAAIAAIKNELVDGATAGLLKCGLTTIRTDLSPLAVYNAYAFNYPQSDECTVLLDIGAKGSNMLFMEKGYFFTRSIPIAGNTLSQNICNDLQEPFATVELMKKAKGYVSLGMDYAEDSEETVARAGRVIRTSMMRLHQEISRSITFYRTQQKGTAPKRLLIAGGTSQLPYLDLFLTERLNLPVEYFNPLRNVTILPTVQKGKLPKQAVLLGEVVGGALRSMKDCPIEVDLTPGSLRDKMEEDRRKPALISALMVWLLLMGAAVFWMQSQVRVAEAELARRKSDTSRLQLDEKKISTLESEFDKKKEALDEIQKLLEQRNSWAEIMHDLNRRIPDGVWITQMTPMFRDANGINHELSEEIQTAVAVAPARGKGNRRPSSGESAAPAFQTPPEINQVVIKGLYKSELRLTIVNEFVAELSKSPWFEIDPNKLSDSIVSTENATENNQALALNYSLNLKLKKPVKLRP